MPRGYPQPMKKTAFDLYVERDRLPWYYKFTTLAASCFILGGFILFPLVFTSDAKNLKASRSSLTSLGAVFFIIGYIAVSVLAVLSKSLLFCFDAVLLPILTSSVVGLASIVFNHALHKNFPVSDSYIVVPLVLASISTVVSALLAGFTYYRINNIRSSDNRRKVRMMREEQSAWPGLRETASMQELLPTWGSLGSVSHMVPEDEQQRQQLLRLLLRRDAARTPSPDRESTYRIDLPGPLSGNDYLRVPNPADPGDDSSLPGSGTRYQLSKLLGGVNRPRSQTTENTADHRQRRREEIERGMAGGRGQPLNISEHWPANPQPHQPYTPGTQVDQSPWSGGGATRYA